MSLQPPDLSEPYSTEAERAHAREALVLYWFAIELLMKLAQQPPDQWSSNQASMFPRSVPGGPPEHPQRRLERWANLYDDEIRIIGNIRNRLVHGGLVADSELRGAIYLASRVIATVMGVPPSQAESAARTALTLGSQVSE